MGSIGEAHLLRLVNPRPDRTECDARLAVPVGLLLSRGFERDALGLPNNHRAPPGPSTLSSCPAIALE
jgi:hypothetical protein